MSRTSLEHEPPALSPEMREAIDPRSIAISFIAHYPGYTEDGGDTASVRGKLALETLRAANEKGYQIVVAVSNQTPSEFIDQVPTGVHILYGEAEQKVARAQAATRNAAELEGVEVIFSAQLEKTNIIPLIPQIVAPILGGKADFVLAQRNKDLFEETFPDYMCQSEDYNNRVINRLLRRYGLLKEGQSLDFFFGVSAFANRPEIIQILLKTYQFAQGVKTGARKYSSQISKTGLGISLISRVELLHEGYKVASVEVPFRYSPEQKKDEEDPAKEEEFRKKRQWQRFVNLTEVIHFLKLKGYGKRKSLLAPFKTGEEV